MSTRLPETQRGMLALLTSERRKKTKHLPSSNYKGHTVAEQQNMMERLLAERQAELHKAGAGKAKLGGRHGGQLIFELGMIGIVAAFAVVKAKPTDNGRWHRNRGRTAWG